MPNALPTYDFANFPDKGFIKKKTFKDIESYDIKVILEYEEFIRNYDLVSATQLLEDNPKILDKSFETEDANRLYEELRNTQIFAMQEQQSIYYGAKPPTFKLEDVWITSIEGNS